MPLLQWNKVSKNGFMQTVQKIMPSATDDLIKAVDNYLVKRNEIDPQDLELIIKLRNFIVKQNRYLDGLLADRVNQVLKREG